MGLCPLVTKYYWIFVSQVCDKLPDILAYFRLRTHNNCHQFLADLLDQ